MNDSFVIIIQARMDSSRLPGKVLKEIEGCSMLGWVVERLKYRFHSENILIATTVAQADDPVVEYCKQNGIHLFRGSEEDVLDRYYKAALKLGKNHIVRITADCPLIDAELVERVLEHHMKTGVDYSSNTLTPTYPDGLDTEVFTFEALKRSWNEASLPSEREHVTQFIIRHPELFRTENVRAEKDHSDLRWTVDEPADLQFVTKVYKYFNGRKFLTKDVLNLMEENPDFLKYNAQFKRNEGLDKSLAMDEKMEHSVELNGSGQKLYVRAKKVIPGGVQLLSKRPEMYLPGKWPAYYKRAKGCEVEDLDGNVYRDFSNFGVGSCLLGYADPDVNTAVSEAIEQGNMSTLNCPEEVELAELLCEIHPWAKMVRYARTGGEAMAVAVRIARAKTGRSKVLVGGYHGWQNWYLAANLGETDALGSGLLLEGLEPNGVPNELKGTTTVFHHNCVEELNEKVKLAGKELAAIVCEVQRYEAPTKEFLNALREAADASGAVLIIDEITSGWRTNIGGIHLRYGLEPDIAVFAKAMSNGYPMAAIIGREDHMQAAQNTFISSTYWTERIGPVAALATIRKFQKEQIPDKIVLKGKLLQKIWQKISKSTGVVMNVGHQDMPPLSHFSFHSDPGRLKKTAWTNLMMNRGYLDSGCCYLTASHSEELIKTYSEECLSALKELCEIEQSNGLNDYVDEVCHAGFKRLTK